MNPTQVKLVQDSFSKVAPISDQAAVMFYDRLFEVAPSVRPLFADVDMERQRQALLDMLLVLRESLRGLDDIVPDLEALGARHADYGAQAAHYPVVGEVLIASMAEIAGDAWKPEYSAAWQDAYGIVQGAMLAGAAARAG